MRGSRIAVLIVIASAMGAPAVQAQQRQQLEPRLTAELHYNTDGDAWFKTNKPAYVAVFDLSRSTAVQLYPSFSAQATERTGSDRRVDLRYANMPGVAPVGGTSLVSLLAPPAGWTGLPHTMLMVASTSPLRVASSWMTNVVLNTALFHEHHYTDVDADEGIYAVLDLVRSTDPNAEIAMDKVIVGPGVSTRYLASLATDPNRVIAAYQCDNGSGKPYLSAFPTAGSYCLALRTIPHSLLVGDSARASNSTKVVSAGGTPATPPAQSRTDGGHGFNSDSHKITDRDEIRRFVESMKNEGTTPGVRDQNPAVRTDRWTQAPTPAATKVTVEQRQQMRPNPAPNGNAATIPDRPAVVARPSNVSLAPAPAPARAPTPAPPPQKPDKPE